MATKASTIFPKSSVNVGEVTKAQLDSAVDKLDTAISALPTTATTDAIKADVTKLKSDLTALDTSKAAAADVAKLDTATKALDKAIKDLAALPADVSQSELDAAIAEYNAKLKTANDAIAVVKTSSDKATTDITALVATVAEIETAFKAVDKTLGDKNTAQDTAIAAVKVTADKAATDVSALATRVTKLEGANYDLEEYALDAGKLFTAAEAIGLFDLVHIRPSDNKIELATDASQDRPADGIVISPVSINGTTKVYGSNAKLSDIGETGISQGKRVFLGANGGFSLSSSGSARLIQQVAVFRGGFYWMTFDDKGYFIA